MTPESLDLQKPFNKKTDTKNKPAWVNLIFDDLENAHYSCAAADIPAAGVGAPHIRQRLWFVAERVGNPNKTRLPVCQCETLGGERRGKEGGTAEQSGCSPGGVANTNSNRRSEARKNITEARGNGFVGNRGVAEGQSTARPVNGFWRDVDWLFCRDGKWRPVEPGTLPLAHGTPNRVGRLRAYGNSICAEEAQIFIETYLEVV